MNFLKKFVNFTEKIFETFAMFLLVLMTLVVGYQIFMRYVFSSTPKWSEELSLVLMVWFVFIGIAIGVKKGIHLSIEFFVERLSDRNKIIIHKLDDILVLSFGYILMTSGYKLAKLAVTSTMPALQVPTTVLYGVVPICGIMIIIYSTLNLFTKKSFGNSNE